MLTNLILIPVAQARPKTLAQWEKCREKAERSLDINTVGMGFMEAAIEKKCGRPPANEKGTNSGAGVHPHDLIGSRTWKKKFMRITKGRYRDFAERTLVAGKTEQQGDWIVGNGQMPHSGGSDEAALAIHRNTGEVYAAMLEDGKIYHFGFDGLNNAPPFIQTWIKDVTQRNEEQEKRLNEITNPQ